jgi:cytochrome c oxidase assembly factor CtaG
MSMELLLFIGALFVVSGFITILKKQYLLDKGMRIFGQSFNVCYVIIFGICQLAFGLINISFAFINE